MATIQTTTFQCDRCKKTSDRSLFIMNTSVPSLSMDEDGNATGISSVKIDLCQKCRELYLQIV